MTEEKKPGAIEQELPKGIDKKSLNEAEIRKHFIDPALKNAGWTADLIKEEYSFTDGRVSLDREKPYRDKKKRADYVLFERPNYPIAIVEAKDNNKPVGGGIQQGMEYAKILGLNFAYSSNGDAFCEYDFITGQERELPLDKFPSPQELTERLYGKNPFDEKVQNILETPYYSDKYSHEPRYYQRIVINKAIEAIANGQNRVLIVMATGTGKTYTAFQIIHRLHASGVKKKILYLADRNAIIDQTISKDFSPFKKRKILTKVKGCNVDSAYEIYMALYHQLVGREGEKNPFEQVQRSFFDLIIVDECHRGSARDDSAWRKVLEYFDSATQIGMTATPKVDNEANNLDYFGDPIYTYSLKQGIEDGFLAPYYVIKDEISVDNSGYITKKDEVDIYGKPLRKKKYERKDFGRSISINSRADLVAKRITEELKKIGRYTKTIVFCPDQDEALNMCRSLINYNSDLMRTDNRYIMRITSDERYGKKQLDNFLDDEQKYPTIVTTSELLSTGIDCKCCGLIVIDKEINSMTEFKQIIGRGTRLLTEKGKWYFTILDFRNATRKFNDPDWDGDPEPPKKPITPDPPFSPDVPDREKIEKNVVYGGNYFIEQETKQTLTSPIGSGSEKIVSYTRFKDGVVKRYASLDSFIKEWKEADRKKAILEEFEELDDVMIAARQAIPELAEADVFDIICFLAYDKPSPSLTRKMRADNIKKRGYFKKYEGKARQVLEALLDKYAEKGIMEMENVNVLDNAPFDSIGKPQKIIKLFGSTNDFEIALKDLEKEIYSDIA